MAKRKVVAEDLLAIKLVGDPQVSPDGTRCVFTVKTIDAEKNRYLSHLWLADLTNGEVRQFTFGEVSDAAPRWSPDGTQIAFVRTDLREKRSQIWLIRADGGEAWQLTKLDEGSIGEPVWSPDGSKIAFTFRPTHPDWTQEARKKRQETGKSNPPRVITRLFYRLDGFGFLDMRQLTRPPAKGGLRDG
jgi:dipeptidyl aminopeptidase/acylaminoacyl peptidase